MLKNECKIPTSNENLEMKCVLINMAYNTKRESGNSQMELSYRGCVGEPGM